MAVQKTGSAARNRRRTDKSADREVVNSGARTDRVALRAYELFVARGGEHGHDVEDWLEAEREIRNGGQTHAVNAGARTLAADDSARGNMRRKPHDDGAALASKID